jgi:glycosyltransferase involved in cell wall biosynthesis
MRVIFLGTRGFPDVQGGVEKHCENLTPRLVRLGCEVIVFTRKSYVDPNLKEYNGVKLVALPSIKHKTFEAFFHTLMGIIVSLKYKPDIIHLQAIGPGAFALCGRFFGKKIVLTTHGSNYKHIKWNKLERKAIKLLERLGMKWSHEIIAISTPIAEQIETEYHRTPHIIPNGVYINKSIDTRQKLAELTLEERKYILTVGRLVPEKGFHDLVKAFQGLNLPGWKLVIVGEADHKDAYNMKLKRMAENNSQIIFTGFLSGIPLRELFSQAGLFVLPSYYEGLPISLLEAMSYGLTCLASKIQGNIDVALPEENYFLAGNISELQKKILEFAANQNTEEEAKAQIEMIENKYNWDRIAEMTFRVYKNLYLTTSNYGINVRKASCRKNSK